MNENVTHAGDILPRDIRLTRLKLIRQMLDRFADDLQSAHHGILHRAIIGKFHRR